MTCVVTQGTVLQFNSRDHILMDFKGKVNKSSKLTLMENGSYLHYLYMIIIIFVKYQYNLKKIISYIRGSFNTLILVIHQKRN